MSHGVAKRRAATPKEGLWILYQASKADIFEAAWDLASLCNEAGSSDDDESTADRLLQAINDRRTTRGARPLKPRDPTFTPSHREPGGGG